MEIFKILKEKTNLIFGEKIHSVEEIQKMKESIFSKSRHKCQIHGVTFKMDGLTFSKGLAILFLGHHNVFGKNAQQQRFALWRYSDEVSLTNKPGTFYKHSSQRPFRLTVMPCPHCNSFSDKELFEQVNDVFLIEKHIVKSNRLFFELSDFQKPLFDKLQQIIVDCAKNNFSNENWVIIINNSTLDNYSLTAQTTEIDILTYNNSDNSLEDGVIINGVKWATRNLDTPRTFAEKIESSGKFYKWNSTQCFSQEEKITNTSLSRNFNHWNDQSQNNCHDPSPKGWKIPTTNEFESLLEESKVKREWISINGTEGIRFTDKQTENTIFIPAAGAFDGGSFSKQTQTGFYWTNEIEIRGGRYGEKDLFSLMSTNIEETEFEKQYCLKQMSIIAKHLYFFPPNINSPNETTRETGKCKIGTHSENCIKDGIALTIRCTAKHDVNSYRV